MCEDTKSSLFLPNNMARSRQVYAAFLCLNAWAILSYIITICSLSSTRYDAPARFAQTYFECVAWRATGSCGKDMPRKRLMGCQETLPSNIMGYCELHDRVTGQTIQVMRSTCRSTKEDVRYSCQNATAFMEFAPASEQYIHAPIAPNLELPWYTCNRLVQDWDGPNCRD